MEYSKVTIEEQVSAWATKTFGPTFSFRKGQKESVVDTIYTWLTGTTDVISNMPTGSGKSIYAMIVAGVLIDYYHKTGYILCSDLGLLDQYAADIEKYLPKWSVIKGQQEYTCLINHMPFKLGQCKLIGCKSYKDIFAKCPECAKDCPYIQTRIKAMDAPLTVVTYPFWLIQQNVVKKAVEVPPFTSRDFTICDEAHKLISIVQDHFSPKFAPEDLNKFDTIVVHTKAEDGLTLVDSLIKCRNEISVSPDNDATLQYLQNYVDSLFKLMKPVDAIKKEYADSGKKRSELSKDKRTFLYACDYLSEHLEKFADYIDTIKCTGTSYMVVNETEDGRGTVFNCLNETYLMDKYFHKQCNDKLYMSATIGDPDIYANEVGATNYHKIVLGSTFDFTNSPIFYVKEYNLSYKQKDINLPRIAELIAATMNMYSNYRGIIQTGSYSFAKQLYDLVPFECKRRMMLYDNSASKGESLDAYKRSDNMVLVGPSLIEGISLDDDLCRFQIVMKVPYPSLKDKYVAAKMKFNPQWYSNTTAISILQGVGRGVRSEHDWCVTMIFDGCFSGLLERSYSMFPEEFIKRIQVIPASSIVH